ARDVEVVGDVGEPLEARHLAPDLSVEQFRDGHSAPIQLRAYNNTTGLSSTPMTIAATPQPRPQSPTTATIPATSAMPLSRIAEYESPTASSSTSASANARATAQVTTMSSAIAVATPPGHWARRRSGSSANAVTPSPGSSGSSKISRPSCAGPAAGSLTPPPEAARWPGRRHGAGWGCDPGGRG